MTNPINAAGNVSYVYVKHNTYEEDSVYAPRYGDSNISISLSIYTMKYGMTSKYAPNLTIELPKLKT